MEFMAGVPERWDQEMVLVNEDQRQDNTESESCEMNISQLAFRSCMDALLEVRSKRLSALSVLETSRAV